MSPLARLTVLSFDWSCRYGLCGIFVVLFAGVYVPKEYAFSQALLFVIFVISYILRDSLI